MNAGSFGVDKEVLTSGDRADIIVRRTSHTPRLYVVLGKTCSLRGGANYQQAVEKDPLLSVGCRLGGFF